MNEIIKRKEIIHNIGAKGQADIFIQKGDIVYTLYIGDETAILAAAKGIKGRHTVNFNGLTGFVNLSSWHKDEVKKKLIKQEERTG